MGRSNGTRTQTCPLCGGGYVRSNWMKRRPVAKVYGPRGLCLLSDTHLIACARKLGLDVHELTHPVIEAGTHGRKGRR